MEGYSFFARTMDIFETMELNPIILSIPIYFILIFGEWIYDSVRNKGWYRLNDAIGNIGCGITEQVTGVMVKVATVALYTFFYNEYRMFDVPHTWYFAVLLFIGVDFFYYWAHRMSHEINLFWLGHVVHHQSEDYNFSVALRQGALQKIFTAPFYIPLALMGFDPYWFLFIGAFSTLYQFWIHTEAIDKMGWFEYIFNTPSHHRVHHGRNPKYIDKNHGGTFIIFDRIFGTFQQEEEHPDYGITVQLSSFNPIRAHLKPFFDLSRELGNARSTSDFMKILFGKPGSIKHQVQASNFSKYRIPLSRSINIYVAFQFLLLLVGIAIFLFNYVIFTKVFIFLLVVLILLNMYLIGRVLDGDLRILKSELTRHCINVVGLSAIVLFMGSPLMLTLAGALVYLILSAGLMLGFLRNVSSYRTTLDF
jgi:alkylglycerol monooxygenase